MVAGVIDQDDGSGTVQVDYVPPDPLMIRQFDIKLA
jgi:hypothetical protein